MNPPNHYSSMTDEQIAQWHQLTTRCDRLEADLAESRKATESVQAHAEVEFARLRGELLQRADLIAEIQLRANNLTVANRWLNGQVVQLAKALRALVESTARFNDNGRGEEEFAMFCVLRREALEVLALVEVPF